MGPVPATLPRRYTAHATTNAGADGAPWCLGRRSLQIRGRFPPASRPDTSQLLGRGVYQNTHTERRGPHRLEPHRSARTAGVAPGATGPSHQTVEVPLSPSTIVTKRLTLTPLVEGDADTMFEVLDDARMHQFTGGSPLTLSELRSRYQRLAVGHSADHAELWFNWIIRITGANKPVGAMQATVTADGSAADVAWEVGVPWQGQGTASEAATAVVKWLVSHNVRLIRACIHPHHDASAQVAERAGLKPTTQRVEGEVVWRRITR
jgi:RimJ/RimL family protein N-acetyltransferase